MDEKDVKYIVEAQAAFADHNSKRQWIAIILLILLCFGTNLAWVLYENSFVDVVTTTIEATQDGNGVNIVSGGDALNVTEGTNN